MDKILKAFINLEQSIPEQSPLVNKLIDKFREQQPFKGISFLLFQHQLGNHYWQTKGLIELGADPEKIYWIDIPYSSNKTVRDAMVRDLGLFPDNFCVYSSSLLEPYSIKQQSRVNKAIKSLIENPPEKLVVLDDGAYFIQSTMCFKKKIPKVAIVEQTNRGIIKLSHSAALREESKRVAIINVAGSGPKSQLEPPFIALAACTFLRKSLKKIDFQIQGKKFLVLGHGNIGDSITRFLNSDLTISKNSIYVFDVKYSQKSGTTEDGFPLWKRGDTVTGFDAVVGCTGTSSFRVDDFVYLNDGAILVSVSSGAVEFSRREFVDLADLYDEDDIFICRDEMDENDLHCDIPIQFPGRKVLMLNGGFPINFQGDVNCIPYEYIAPTVCFMIRAAIQAVEALKNNQNGLIELDPSFCRWITDEFTAFLGENKSILNKI